MNKLLLVVALAAATYFALARGSDPLSGPEVSAAAEVSSLSHDSSDAALENAFANHISNLQVAGKGTVARILPDDNDGSRHQRFIIRLNSGQTLLMSHNIDLAPRIDSLSEGDMVAFYGEYEWNPKGGVIHWTHRDPQGSHPAGWIKHNSSTYQ